MSFAFEHFAVLLTNVTSVAKKPTEHLFVLPPAIHFGQRANYQVTQMQHISPKQKFHFVGEIKKKKFEFKQRQITTMPKECRNVNSKSLLVIIKD